MRTSNWLDRARHVLRLLLPTDQGRYDDRLTPRLFVRELEDRCVLSASPLPWNAGAETILDAGAQADDGLPDVFHITRQGDDLRVTLNGATVYQTPLADVGRLAINGSGDDDTLVLDLSGGPLPLERLSFDGGGQSAAGGDRLTLLADAPQYAVDTLACRCDRVGAGQIDATPLAGASSPWPSTVAYGGVEWLLIDAPADNLLIELPADSPLSRVSSENTESAAVLNVDVAAGHRIEAAFPAQSLSISASAAASAQTIEVGHLDAPAGMDVSLLGNTNDAVVFQGDVRLDGGDLRIDAGPVRTTSPINVNDGRVDSRGTSFDGTGAAILADAIRINHTGAVCLGDVQTGTLDVIAGGAITDVGHVLVDGHASFSAAGGNADITLGDGTVANFGRLSLEGRVANIREASATELGTVEVMQMTLTSAGAITDVGHVLVDGHASFSAAGGNADITLGDGTVANFGRLSLEGRVANIREASATELGTVEVAQLTLTSAGAITDVGHVLVDGHASFSAAGGNADITLGDGTVANFGRLSLEGRVASVREASATELGTVEVAQLTLTSAGAITDVGNVLVDGHASFSAAGGNADITLGDGTVANFGRLSLEGRVASVREASATELGTVEVAQLTLTSAGAITDVGNVHVLGRAIFSASGDITLGDRPGEVTNFGSVELSGKRIDVSEDSNTLLVGAVADSLRFQSAGHLVVDEKPVVVQGAVTIRASGNLDVRDFRPSGVLTPEISAYEMTLTAGGLLTLHNGAVLKSATGSVTNAPPQLSVVSREPYGAVIPGYPIQQLVGLAGASGSGGNLEQGSNFTLAIVGNDGQRSELGRLTAGDEIVWQVPPTGNGEADRVFGTGTGPVEFVILREYSLDYLYGFGGGRLMAGVELRNDPLIRLDDGRAIDLNRVFVEVSSPFLGGGSVSPTTSDEAQGPRAVGPAAALGAWLLDERPSRPTVPDYLDVAVAPDLPLTTVYELHVGGTVIGETREVYMVRVLKRAGQQGEEEVDKQSLQDDVLLDMPGFFEKLKHSGVPNGRYRIYVEESGFPRRRVIEIYKFGETIGDTSRETPPGAKPLDSEKAPARGDQPVPPPGSETPDGSASRSDESPAWAAKVAALLETADEQTFSRAARLSRRVRAEML